MEIVFSVSGTLHRNGGGLGAVTVGLAEDELACPACGQIMLLVTATLSPKFVSWDLECVAHGRFYFIGELELPAFLAIAPDATG